VLFQLVPLEVLTWASRVGSEHLAGYIEGFLSPCFTKEHSLYFSGSATTNFRASHQEPHFSDHASCFEHFFWKFKRPNPPSPLPCIVAEVVKAARQEVLVLVLEVGSRSGRRVEQTRWSSVLPKHPAF
jgi:hypothetical protein